MTDLVMTEPTKEEMMELVEFEREFSGRLRVKSVKSDVWGNVEGAVYGDIYGDVFGSVVGSVVGSVRGHVWGDVSCVVHGDVHGNVLGTIHRRKWKFLETAKEMAARLIRESKGEEAIKVMENEL